MAGKETYVRTFGVFHQGDRIQRLTQHAVLFDLNRALSAKLVFAAPA